MGIRQNLIRSAAVLAMATSAPAFAAGAALLQDLKAIVGSYTLAAGQPTVCLSSLAVVYDEAAVELRVGDFHTFSRINMGESVEDRDDGKVTIAEETVHKKDKVLHVRVVTERDVLAEVASYVKSRLRTQHLLQLDQGMLRTSEVASDGFVLSCAYKRAGQSQ
jgi:hypothetical protein